MSYLTFWDFSLARGSCQKSSFSFSVPIFYVSLHFLVSNKDSKSEETKNARLWKTTATPLWNDADTRMHTVCACINAYAPYPQKIHTSNLFIVARLSRHLAMYSAQLSQSCVLHGDSISPFYFHKVPQREFTQAWTYHLYHEKDFSKANMARLREVGAKLRLME